MYTLFDIEIGKINTATTTTTTSHQWHNILNNYESVSWWPMPFKTYFNTNDLYLYSYTKHPYEDIPNKQQSQTGL